MTNQGRDRVTCTKCGSTYFQLAEFRQYRGGICSATPGGELSPIGPPIEVRVCLCGHPIAPRKRLSLMPDLRKSVNESLEGAQRFRHSTEPETIQRGIREEFASKAELLSANTALATLTKVLEIAEKDKGERAAVGDHLKT
jgi:hypothetical protein